MRLLPGFDPLDIPDLEAVRVQLNASPVLYDDSRDGLLILRENAPARVTGPAVTRTIEDLRDGPRGSRPSSNRSLMSLRISGSMRDV